MNPEELIKIIQALDELVESATKETVNNRDFAGQNLLDFVGEDVSDYWDTLPREDGLLVFGPYDLEELVGAGRSDLNLVIDVITDEVDTDIITGFSLQIMDQSTQSVGGPNMMRPEIDEIFQLDLGEFSTKQEMKNLFTKTLEIEGATAKVSLVGDKLDEIFPNSTASIEMALTNQGPIISDRLRRDIGRDFIPPYAREAFEKVDAEQALQYKELIGDVEVPNNISSIDTPTNIDDIRILNDSGVSDQVDNIMAGKINDLYQTDGDIESFSKYLDNLTPDTFTTPNKIKSILGFGKEGTGMRVTSRSINDGIGSRSPIIFDESRIDDLGYVTWKNLQHEYASFQPSPNNVDGFELVKNLIKEGNEIDFESMTDVVDDIDKLDFDGPDITLNPDGSTTTRGPGYIANEDVPLEEFKIMFGGNPYEKPLPEIFNDIKDTAEYKQTQFHLHSMNLEYQDRKKFLNWTMQQYDIAFEFAKDLSPADKKILLDEMSLRLLRFDEKYNKMTVKKDVDLSLEELTTFDNLIENDANNLRNELPGIIDEAKLKGMDASTTGSDEALGEIDFQEAEKSAGDFPPDQLEGEGPKEGDFGRDAPDEIDYRYQLVDEEFNKITNNINNLVEELPLEETFKNQVKKNTARISKNVATPGGIIDFIDAWELGVLALGVTAIATGEIDEIPTIMYNQGVKMYNSMLSSVGLPVQVEEKPYNINFKRAINTFNIAEMFMPTAYVEKAAVKEFKKGQEAGIDISVGLGAGVGVPPMQFKTEEPKEDTGNINSIMTNLMSNISNAQKSYPVTFSEITSFSRNPIQTLPINSEDKPVKVEYDSKEKQNLHDIYANLYTKLSNASARIE